MLIRRLHFCHRFIHASPCLSNFSGYVHMIEAQALRLSLSRVGVFGQLLPRTWQLVMNICRSFHPMCRRIQTSFLRASLGYQHTATRSSFEISTSSLSILTQHTVLSFSSPTARPFLSLAINIRFSKLQHIAGILNHRVSGPRLRSAPFANCRGCRNRGSPRCFARRRSRTKSTSKPRGHCSQCDAHPPRPILRREKGRGLRSSISCPHWTSKSSQIDPSLPTRTPTCSPIHSCQVGFTTEASNLSQQSIT
jgi:hypothetical protein